MDKKKIGLFLIPILFISVSSAFAAPFDQIGDTEIGINYDQKFLNRNPDGSKSYQITTQPKRILDHYENGVPVFSNYKLFEDSNIVRLETENSGSYVFNKLSCAYDISEPGVIDQNNAAKIKDVSWTIKGKSNSSQTWSNLNGVNNAACSVTVTSNATAVKLVAEKQTSQAIFQAVLDFSPQVKIKETLRGFNNNPAWNNHNIGFTEKFQVPRIIHIGNRTYDLADHNNTVLDRNWLIENKSFMFKLSEKLSYDFGIGFKNLNDVKITWINSKAYLSLNYLYPGFIVPYQTWFEIDPTFGPDLASSEGSVYPSAGTGIDCTARTGNSVPASITITKNTGATNCQIYWGEFDISIVPVGSTATAAYFEYDQTLTSSWIDTCRLRSYTTQPSTLSTAQKYSEGWTGTGLGSVACTTDATDRRISLNSTGLSDLNAKIATGAGWWATSLQGGHIADGTLREFSMAAGNQKLSFNYTSTPPPNAVTDLTATAISKTEIFLDWTTPELHGETLLGYQINSTTPYGIPLTIIVNNTGTSTTEYTHTGLTACTQYTHRVTAWTAGGNNVTLGTKANATTACFTPPAKPLSLTATAQNDTAVRFTSVNGTTGDFNITWFGLRCVENNLGPWLNTVPNSTVPNPRVYIYGGLTTSETITCQWRDGSAAGFGPWSDNATGQPQLAIIQSQRSPTSNPLSWVANFIEEKGGLYFGLGLFPFIVMIIGLLATPRTTHIFTLITLFLMGILHGSGFFVYPEWFWAIMILLGIVLVWAKR